MNREQNPQQQRQDRYWRGNLKLVALLLSIWFSVSFGAGILLVDTLNLIPLGGFKLGFWFAQQGSIYTFVALIFIYAWRMRKLDNDYRQDARADADADADAAPEDDKGDRA